MKIPTSPPIADYPQVAERCRATPNCEGAILDGYCAVCGKVAGRFEAGTTSPATSG